MGVKGFKNGGIRPGQGRKKAQRTIGTEQFREYLVAEVMRERVPLIKVLMDSGKAGNINAIKELFDRAFGKSKESVDVTSKGESINVLPENYKKIIEEFETKYKEKL